MNVTELKSEGLNKEFKVSISAADFAQKVDEKIKQIAKNFVPVRLLLQCSRRNTMIL